MLKLAKPALDVGLYTNQLEAALAFWQDQAHLPFDELLPIGGGLHQHRHKIGQSILKVNNTRDPIPPGAPTGLRRFTIYSDLVDEALDLIDPDGNEVTLHPRVEDTNLKLTLAANNVERSAQFYGGVLGLPEVEPSCFAVGKSLIQLTEGEVGEFERTGIGYRYMTVQVFDVVSTHQAIVSAGGGEGMRPVRLGDVAYISFVLDPDGNWLEISQRKSITGSLE